MQFLRWPRELKALQLQKTHANRKSTSKSRNHFSSFWQQMVQMFTTQTNKETHGKCSQHTQIHFICSAFIFWVCCELLQRVRCQIDESVFLICRCFFLFAGRFFFWVVLWAFAACALSNWRKCFLNLQVFFSICSAFLFWFCCEHLQRVRCKIEEVVSLICRCFFYLQRVELSRPP